ncbi:MULTISPECIES: hypothetical protein [unclassified Paenibacillus]|nr:hypothetical protein [Paenibacillus sp. FSL R5-0345]
MGNASTMEIVAGAVRAGTDQQDITQNAHIHHNLNTKSLRQAQTLHVYS